MENQEIKITKAKVHNLKSISINIPKNKLTVITGPSGSGKSSLAFDTIYVEGQRRYIESLSSYARQFLGQFQPPDVESITGLSPAIAIDQKTSSKNPRSTVGTITEIYDYMRVLFARAGTLYCLDSGEEVKKYTVPQIVREILEYEEKTKVFLLAPVHKGKSNEIESLITKFAGMGFSRIRLNGEIQTLDSDIILKKNKEYELDIIVDRILLKKGVEKRLSDSVEHALKLGDGKINIVLNEAEEISYSERNMAPGSGRIYPDLEPRLFSFNSPIGACPTCNGLGESKSFVLEEMILDDSLSIIDGAIPILSKRNNFLLKMVESVAKVEKVDLKKPLKSLPKKFTDILYYGTTKTYKYTFKSENSNFEFSKVFPGIIEWLNKKFHETTSEKVRVNLEKFMKIQQCTSCDGLRLNEVALATLIQKKNIMDISTLSIQDSFDLIKKVKLSGEKAQIAEKILKEIICRLKFLVDVGLGYLTLNRPASTMSGGESQRIRLATQIGSALSGVLYVLDEPSIGLHQRDNTKLIKTLKNLRDIGNTVLVVEHDEETMMESDFIIDMGPGAGEFGGEVVEKGKTKDFLKSKKSLTAKYLRQELKIDVPETRRKLKKVLKLKGAQQNNLKKVNVEIPLGGLVCVTGVSGSGKSTLVHEILVPACKTYLARANKSLYQRNNYNSISGVDEIKTVIELDQSPIGRTPHSNPATYSGVFDAIRILFSKTPESQIRGYKQGRFSFNVKGGRCEECEGNGVKKIEMHFLPDVYITCNECKGCRYNRETLSILFRGKNIADILKMSISEATEFFKNHPRIHRIIGTMNSVGLGYMSLGQPATTLSGGEAQRLKLSRELAKRTKGHCLYVLDEPTTGLHFEDIKVLLKALDDLVEQGNSMVIIEHNLDVIKTADHIIDLGPEGGDGGGNIVGTGTPEEVVKVKGSYTGKYLKKCLK